MLARRPWSKVLAEKLGSVREKGRPIHWRPRLGLRTGCLGWKPVRGAELPPGLPRWTRWLRGQPSFRPRYPAPPPAQARLPCSPPLRTSTPGRSEPAPARSASVVGHELPLLFSDPLDAPVGWARQEAGSQMPVSSGRGSSGAFRKQGLGVCRAQGRAGETTVAEDSSGALPRERVSPPPYARRWVHPCQLQLCWANLRHRMTLSSEVQETGASQDLVG